MTTSNFIPDIALSPHLGFRQTPRVQFLFGHFAHYRAAPKRNVPPVWLLCCRGLENHHIIAPPHGEYVIQGSTDEL